MLESSSLCGRFLSRPLQPCAIRSHSSRSNSDFAKRACFSASAACRRYSSSRFITNQAKAEDLFRPKCIKVNLRISPD